jgi:hypothetical protein
MLRSLIPGLVLVGAGVTGVNAVAHQIDVGMGGDLTFSPNSLTAAVGDT